MKRLKIFLNLVKFEHTVFALPFAYAGVFLGGRGHASLEVWLWVTVAMASARTAGMCLNRLIDLKIDARNPRTRGRALVTGDFSIRASWMIVFLCLLLLVISSYQLNPLCFKLAPLALLLLTGYHYLKRWTPLCHLGIGLVLAAAPFGGWIAARGAPEPATWLLSGSVLFWVAGFDMIYSSQDADFDRREGLKSLPARFGVPAALNVAAVCHVLTLGILIALGIMIAAGMLYWTGLAVCAAILWTEHRLVRKDFSRYVNLSFFTLNGCVSLLFFVMTALSVPV